MDQGRRHKHKLRADIEIHLARLFEISQILRRDGGDRDIADVDLLLADQIEQKVERALVMVEMNVKGRAIDDTEDNLSLSLAPPAFARPLSPASLTSRPILAWLGSKSAFSPYSSRVSLVVGPIEPITARERFLAPAPPGRPPRDPDQIH